MVLYYSSSQRREFNSKFLASEAGNGSSQSRRDYIRKLQIASGRKTGIVGLHQRQRRAQVSAKRRDQIASDVLNDDCIKRPRGGVRTRGAGVAKTFKQFC